MIAAKSLATIKCESLLATAFPLKDDEVLLASEEKIKEAALNGPVIAWGGIDQDQRKVVRISEGTVAKFDWTDMLAEATNMDFVYRNAPSVRVPKMLRYFRLDGVMFIIMEFVRGTNLSELSWEDMSEDRRQRICEQVVRSIGELQTLQLPNPGPIGGGYCHSPCNLFTLHGAGPFQSISELESFYTDRMKFSKHIGHVPADAPTFQGTFGESMVMSHLDIARRNIILEDGDKICLIDWEFAGAYPPHFERAVLERMKFKDVDFTERILDRLPLYEREMDKLRSIDFALSNSIAIHEGRDHVRIDGETLRKMWGIAT